MKNQAHPIVVVRRRKSKHHAQGGHGSWKIAYADFMTAMMAFFLVMWLISISSPKELAQIADYFRTPLAQAITGGQRLSDSTSPVPGAAMMLPSNRVKLKNNLTLKSYVNVWKAIALNVLKAT